MSVETEDLEALFEQVASQSAAKAASSTTAPAAPAAAKPASAGADEEQADVFHRIGFLTRGLHDALRELGYDKVVEQAATTLPDARDRLDYIATLTGKAAERALAAAEIGLEQQKQLDTAAAQLARDWDRAFDGTLSLEEFKSAAVATRTFLKGVPTTTGVTNAQFTEIMMAQDFHDLTGQVIQRIVKLALDMEGQLLKLLLETSPPEKRPATEEGWLTGPAMNAEGRSDVVTSQQQVDDLLGSLGF